MSPLGYVPPLAYVLLGLIAGILIGVVWALYSVGAELEE